MDYPEVPRFVSDPDPVPPPTPASPASDASPTARTDDYDSESHSPTNDDAYAGDHDGQTDGHGTYAGDNENDGDAYELNDNGQDGTSYNNVDTGATNEHDTTPHDSADDVIAAWPPQSTWDPIFADLWREMEGGESSLHVSSEPV